MKGQSLSRRCLYRGRDEMMVSKAWFPNCVTQRRVMTVGPLIAQRFNQTGGLLHSSPRAELVREVIVAFSLPSCSWESKRVDAFVFLSLEHSYLANSRLLSIRGSAGPY